MWGCSGRGLGSGGDGTGCNMYGHFILSYIVVMCWQRAVCDRLCVKVRRVLFPTSTWNLPSTPLLCHDADDARDTVPAVAAWVVHVDADCICSAIRAASVSDDAEEKARCRGRGCVLSGRAIPRQHDGQTQECHRHRRQPRTAPVNDSGNAYDPLRRRRRAKWLQSHKEQ
jgi:hypothetical protein